MNQMITAIAEPVEGEVSLAYEVEVRAIGPVALLSDDGRAVLQELMDRAKSAAIDVLDGSAPPPASLAARVQIAIQRWDELAKVEAAYAKAANDDDPACTDFAAAFEAARDAFEDAFNILITRFEKEFPRGSHH